MTDYRTAVRYMVSNPNEPNEPNEPNDEYTKKRMYADNSTLLEDVAAGSVATVGTKRRTI